MASKTSQLDLCMGEVILKIGSVLTEKFKVKVEIMKILHALDFPIRWSTIQQSRTVCFSFSFI